jgi:GTP-binding protein
VSLVQTTLAWLHTARFFNTVATLDQLPHYHLPEIAFVGRSNSGKSTCINTLTQQKRLAFASKTPGRTQHINLFILGQKAQYQAVLADLPGYGYAAVPLKDKQRWQKVMASYLASRQNLAGIVLLCDIRRGLTILDEILLELIRPKVENGMPFLVLLTKADKLNKQKAHEMHKITQLQCTGGQAMLFSTLTRQGVDQVAKTLWSWVHPSPLTQEQ